MPRLIRERDFPNEPEEEYKRNLCYEGGDRIIDLLGGEVLVLNSEILGDENGFFGPNSPAYANRGETVIHPKSGVEVKVLTYTLTHSRSDKVLILDSGISTIKNGAFNMILWEELDPFYLSKLASGFKARHDKPEYDRVEEALFDSQYEHRVAFSLLYDTYTELHDLTYANIANITAMTQVYGFFDLIAPALRKHLLAMPDLWSDVRDDFSFHLVLSKHLKCREVFSDALRHYIGSNASVKVLMGLDFEADYVIDIMQKREEFQSTINKLQAELQALTLTTYIPNADKESHGAPAKTSYLASSYDFGYISQATKIAQDMVMEWMIQQVSGTPHWSHVRNYNSYEDPVFERGSLRNICNLATRAVQRGTELDLFDPEAADRFVEQAALIEQSLKPYAVEFVKGEVKKLVGQIASKALPYIAPPDFKPAMACVDAESGEIFPDQGAECPEPCYGCSRGRRAGEGLKAMLPRFSHTGVTHHNHRQFTRFAWPGFKMVGMTAEDDAGCHYFTCVNITEKDFPWSVREDFETFKIKGVEDASKEWLIAIGVIREKVVEDVE